MCVCVCVRACVRACMCDLIQYLTLTEEFAALCLR